MTRPEPIRLVVPALGDAELREVAAVLESGFLTQGPKVAEFEELVRTFIGASHAIATTSATTALHLTLAALEIGPGDEVIVPDFTFPATANVVIQQGATPILVDIDPVTFTLDPAATARAIGPRTRAVMPVHAFGLCADMDGVFAAVGERPVAIIEDAACAIGATYRGRAAGTLGRAGCFSFHPRKAITTGEGGMVVTDDAELAQRARMLRTHGGVRTDGRFRFEAAGFNYRLSDVLAAIGVAQMRNLDGFIAEKRAGAAVYSRLLSNHPAISVPKEPEWGGHVYQSYVVLLDERVDRDGVIAAMREEAIETTLGTYALHAEPYYGRALGLKPGHLPNSFEICRRSLTLPLYPGLRHDQIERVADALLASVARAS